MSAHKLTDEKRRQHFWDKVNKRGPRMPHMKTRCWVWTGSKDSHGYGQLNRDKAHRFAFFLAEGRWPTPCGLHRCDNRACVRRSHLFEGTKTDNNLDMCRKGRNVRGENVPSSKLRAEQVREMRQRRAAGDNLDRIASDFDVSQTQVSYITRGKSWSHV
jgi:HNH endonuclease